MKHQVQGSVTVFLALTFLLILSMVLAMLESARTASLRVYAQLALSTSVESVMADFYRPLFDEYGLYGLDSGFGDRVADSSELSELIEQYLVSNLEMGETDALSVEVTHMLTGKMGSNFISQAVEAEQTVIAEYAVTELLTRIGALTDQTKTLQVLERKTAVENKLSGLDSAALNLRKLIDGVDINRKPTFFSGKVYRITKQFVKSFMIMEPNAVNVSVNNQKLLEELLPYYQNPIRMTEELGRKIRQMSGLVRERDEMTEQLLEAEKEEADSDIISQQLEEFNRSIEELAGQCNKLSDEIVTLVEKTLSLMEQAVRQLNSMDVLCDEVRPVVLEYEEFLVDFLSCAEDSLAGDLLESLDEMKAYVGLDNSGSALDYSRMRTTLDNNIMILADCSEMYGLGVSPLDSAMQLETKLAELEALTDKMARFSYEGLEFDYSGLKTETVKNEIFDIARSEINASLAEGILEFIMPEGTELSEQAIETSMFPSISDETDDESYAGTGMSDEIMGAADENQKAELLNEEGNSLGDISTKSALGDLADMLADGLEKMYDKAMLTLYLDDKFSSYPDGNKAHDRVLEYEQEFLIAGKESDKENLASVALMIMLTRVIPAAIFTYTDKDTVNQVRSFVSGTVGMLGMPFLTAVATALILLVWALEQAVVETAAIMAGYGVPVLTTEATFCISFSELVMFSADLVQSKAETFKGASGGLQYGDYLKMLLLVKSETTLAERSLGLIQENLRYAYDEDFLICNCITGVKCSAVIADDAAYISVFPGIFGDRAPGRYGVSVQATAVY